VKLSGVCITTTDAPRLAAFYQTVFEEEPFVEEIITRSAIWLFTIPAT
jgi:hypothetical protein